MKKLAVLLLFVASTAYGEIYTWRDSRGTNFYSNSRYDIPARYLSKAKILDVATGKKLPLTAAQPAGQPAPAVPPASQAPVPQPAAAPAPQAVAPQAPQQPQQPRQQTPEQRGVVQDPVQAAPAPATPVAQERPARRPRRAPRQYAPGSRDE